MLNCAFCVKIMNYNVNDVNKLMIMYMVFPNVTTSPSQLSYVKYCTDSTT